MGKQPYPERCERSEMAFLSFEPVGPTASHQKHFADTETKKLGNLGYLSWVDLGPPFQLQ